jgi:Major tropism determinant N-terminal domain
MAIVQISRIQHRRGLQEDLPSLASAELGWSIDSRKLYIGNGTLAEGAPVEGHTEILTEFSIIDFTQGFASNVQILNNIVSSLGGNAIVASLPATTTGSIIGISSNNATISYTLNQGAAQRTGTLKFSRHGTTASSDEEYTQTALTDIVLSVDGSSGTQANLNFTTILPATIIFRVAKLP